jgi:hypothetical protein
MLIDDILINSKLLDEHRRSGDAIHLHIIAYENACRKLFLDIKKLSYENSQNKFDDLFKLQASLYTLYHKYQYTKVNANIVNFIYHFDRNDEESRIYWYAKIVDGFSWDSFAEN